MKFYNTLTKSLEEFAPLEPGRVRMYNCGPTVYDSQHVGNYRTFSFADTLRRYLEYRGFKVTQVMNLTDVGHLTQDQVEAGGDKMEEGLRRLREKGVQVSDPYQVADHFIREFFEDRKKIHLLDAHHHPRATRHVEEMIAMIAKLLKTGFAYQVGGNVYFEVAKFPAYGKLSGNTIESIKSGARIEPNPEKKHPADFALWKTDPNHLMQFDSPWGRGFPGWHIECSAMSRQYLGDTFDIHTGGEDNIFPHHECEIAQSEAFTGKPFVKFWIHARHMLWEGKKMSKSEGTFYKLRDLIDRGYPGDAIRYALVTTHYRQQVSFSMKSFDDAKGVVGRFREFHDRVAASPDGPELLMVASAKIKFSEAMDEDLNTSGAAGVVHEFVREANRTLDAGKPVPGVRAAFEGFMSVFGIPLTATLETPAAVQSLVSAREDARKRKDWKESDRLRDEIQKLGWIVKDTKDGPKLTKS